MILLITGDGKGKTTSALGQMMRVLGRGKSALMIQFIKGPWRSGEDEFGEKYQISKDKFQIRKMGLGFVGILGDTLPKEKHMEAAKNALAEFVRERKTAPPGGGWHLIVLDEINVAISLGLLTVGEVLDAIKDYPENSLLMLTGRGAPQELIDMADLVTETKDVKHPYWDGKDAKATVEF
ncbi:MAG TPA: cob(I)yrinic acid a,c-diamide adenosyltransferase [Candidatus Paceibacterota bacterium]